jgi:hypothetical protein
MDGATGKRTWLRRAGVSGGAAMIAVAVAACASPGGSAPGGGGQPTRPSVSPTTFADAGALPKASWVRLLTHGLNSRTQLLRSDPGALSCFRTAAKACKAARLAVTEMGVDSGTSDVIIVESSGAACRVSLWQQGYSANGGGSKSKVSATPCRLGTVTNAGVRLSCAGENLLIPANVG